MTQERVGWMVDLWDAYGHGFRLSVSAENGCLEFGLMFTREEAENGGLLKHCTHGDSSARTKLKKLDPECEVYLYGGLLDQSAARQFLRRALLLLEEDGE